MRQRLLKYNHNSDSPESMLSVKYKIKYDDIKGSKTIELNPFHFKNKLTIESNPIKNKESQLRKQQFESYTNENMDFFRLDYLNECDRSNHHNRYMDILTPINRSETFQKINNDGQKIKFIDSLKKNFLLNQDKNIMRNILYKKPKYNVEENNFSSLQNIINRNNSPIYDNISMKNMDNNSYSYPQTYQNREKNNFIFYRNTPLTNKFQVNKSCELNLSENRHGKFSKEFNTINNEIPNCSSSYISNLNDYSVNEDTKNKPYKPEIKICKESELIRNCHLFCKDVVNGCSPSLFYKVYDKNFNDYQGFKKENNIFSNYVDNSLNKIKDCFLRESNLPVSKASYQIPYTNPVSPFNGARKGKTPSK